MRIDPRLLDTNAVFVYRRPVPTEPAAADFEAAATEAMAAIGLELEGETVVLKPNVTTGETIKDPASGITTHPAFVGGMVRYLRRHGANAGSIQIIEDPHNRDDESPCHWRGTGYIEMAREVGARLACPTRGTVVRRAIPNPLAHGSRLVSSPAVAPGAVYINVPKLKTHNLAITTLCMKNQQGLVYVLERHYCRDAMDAMQLDVDTSRPRQEWMDAALHERWQHGLACRLADLAKVLTPTLNVVEGVVGRDGTGFGHGTNFPLGLVVAGINMVAVDAVASHLMGFDPEALIYLQVAAEAGLGTHCLDEITVYQSGPDGLVPCPDLNTWRAAPAFEVIRNIRGERRPSDARSA